MNNKLFIVDALVYDPLIKEKKKKNILINNGVIKDITTKVTIPQGYLKIDCSDMIVTTGFVDIRAHFKDPGNSYEETLYSGSAAAVAGGYTKVCIMPDTNPIIDNGEIVDYINSLSEMIPIDIFTIGAATSQLEGQELSEIGLMKKSGIVAISDYEKPIQNGQLLRMIIEYAKKFDIPVINHPEDLFLSNSGVMHEGNISTTNGMAGIPDISESTMLFRDISIASYVKGRIHVPHVSSKRSVELIRDAKDKGIQVTSEVTPHHLYFNHEKFSDFNSKWKVCPPVRTESDRNSLIEALIEGSIDCIATDHSPHRVENKENDLYNASYGTIGLESAFGAVNKVMSKYKIDTFKVIDWLTVNPASIMKIDLKEISPKNKVNLTIIDPKKEWIFNSNSIKSNSTNSIFDNQKLYGKIIHTIIGSKIFSN